MLRIRLCEDYKNWYWDSGVGHTLTKENREGMIIDENNNIVRMALESGFLELVTDEELKRVKEENTKKEQVKPEPAKIITDVPKTENTIKEVVSPQNTEQINAVKEEAKKEDDGSKQTVQPTGQEYRSPGV